MISRKKVDWYAFVWYGERTLRDKIKTTQLGAYNLTGTTDKSLALVPGLAKQFLLINPNVQQQQ